MSDVQRIFTLFYTYMFQWMFLGVYYLLLTGIMQIINMVFHFEQNPWLVGFVVLFIMTNHTQAKKVSREVTEIIEEKEEDKK